MSDLENQLAWLAGAAADTCRVIKMFFVLFCFFKILLLISFVGHGLCTNGRTYVRDKNAVKLI